MSYPDPSQADLFATPETEAEKSLAESDNSIRSVHVWEDLRNGETAWSHGVRTGSSLFRWHRRWKKEYVVGYVGEPFWRRLETN